MGDKTLVRADVGSEHGIKVIPDGKNLFTLGDIPHGGETNIGATASTNNEILAIGGKFKAARVTLVIGNDPGNVEAVGVVQQNLALSPYGNERRPRTDRH